MCLLNVMMTNSFCRETDQNEGISFVTSQSITKPWGTKNRFSVTEMTYDLQLGLKISSIPDRDG
jgi:hypothetical protein